MSDINKEIQSLKSRLESLEKTINGSKNNLFGKPSQELGSNSSDTIIRTLGSLKVRYGSKYVTIFKDGKLVSDEMSKLIYVSDKIGNKEGIHIIQQEGQEDFSVYIVYKGKSYELASSILTYVSFLESQITSSENKRTAQKNLGITYNSIEDYYNDNGIQDGIIYISNENKIYLVSKGIPKEYKIQLPENYEELNVTKLIANQIKLNDVIISNSGINGTSVFQILNNTFNDNSLKTGKINCNSIESNLSNGFYLKQINDEWVLKVDKVISSDTQQKPLYYPYDIIVDGNSLKTLYNTFDGKYKEGDVVAVSYQSEEVINNASYTLIEEFVTELDKKTIIPETTTTINIKNITESYKYYNQYKSLYDNAVENNLSGFNEALQTNPDNIFIEIQKQKEYKEKTFLSDQFENSYVSEYTNKYCIVMTLFSKNKGTVLPMSDSSEILDRLIHDSNIYEYSSKYEIDTEIKTSPSEIVYETVYDIDGSAFNSPVELNSKYIKYTKSTINKPDFKFFKFNSGNFVIQTSKTEDNWEYVENPDSLVGAFLYPIKINEEFHPLFEFNDSFNVILPYEITSDETSPKLLEFKLDNNIVTISKDGSYYNNGLILKSTESDNSFAKYSDDSFTIPQNCSDKTLITKEWVSNYSFLPSGVIMAFYGSIIPKGWVLCDGQTYDKDGNVTAGLGITTPDLSNKIIIGEGDSTIGDYLNLTSSEVGINSYNLVALKYIMKL